MTNTANTTLDGIGESAISCIRSMVAALTCNYDRLQALRDERDDYEPVVDADDAAELAELEAAATDSECCDDAARRIHEDPLCIEVRSGWTSLGEPLLAEHYCLLLTTGGPAVGIVGDLDGGEATSARLEVQDWGTPWTEYATTDDDDDALLTYVGQFYFGE